MAQVALAILLVDYLHRITVIHIRVFRFLRLSNIGVCHGPQCFDEENCRDVLGNMPNSFVSGFVTLKCGIVKVVPDRYAVHAIVLFISSVGLLIEVYVSFMNLLVFGVNFVLIVAGLHRADVLKHFVAPFIKLYNIASEYHCHVAQAVTSLEESFVNELNEGIQPEEAHAQSGNCVLTKAMSEMCAGLPMASENEVPSVQLMASSERARRPHRVSHAAEVEPNESDVDNEDSICKPALHERMFAEDSDGDSLILNESRIPSPTRSWSSTEELVPSNRALLFSENDSDAAADEEDEDDDLSLSQIGAKERSRRGTLANNAVNSGNSTSQLDSREPSLIANTLSAGFQAITNLAFKAFDTGIVPDVNAQTTKPKNPQTTQSNEEFVFVDGNRDHGDVYERDTLPTSLQIDSQGPYTFFYETRSRARKSGGGK